MWALRLFYGGILSAFCGAAIRAFLARPTFEQRFGPLFGLALVFVAAGAFTFAQAEEPPVEVSKKEMHLAEHLRTNVRAAWHDPAFRALFGTRVALAAAFLATPFYALFAVRQLGLERSLVGAFLSAKIVGYVASNLLWQRVAARRGGRRLMQLVGAMSGVSPLVALAALFVPAAGPWRGLAMGLAFAGLGATVSGVNIGYQSMLLAIAPVARRPSYVGLMNSFVGPAMVLPVVGGLVADFTRPEAVFALSFVAAGISVAIAGRLPEHPAPAVGAGPSREGEIG
jgi:Na+/melibiose symporter-like transporter